MCFVRLKLIVSKALTHEVDYLKADCGNQLDVAYLRQSDHENPDELRDALQECIDKIDQSGDNYDAIVIAYGLCGEALCGLRSARYPMVVPRAHDCATLVLGTRERYRQLFDEDGSAFVFAQGWLEHGTDARTRLERYRDNAVCIRLEEVTYAALPACITRTGDGGLLRGLMGDTWNEQDYLYVAQGKTIEASYTSDIVQLAGE